MLEKLNDKDLEEILNIFKSNLKLLILNPYAPEDPYDIDIQPFEHYGDKIFNWEMEKIL